MQPGRTQDVIAVVLARSAVCWVDSGEATAKQAVTRRLLPPCAQEQWAARRVTALGAGGAADALHQ